jgi:hypothetical protein
LTETKKYVTFTVVLLIWELIPTFVIVILFRLKKSFWELNNRSTDWSIQSNSVRKSVFIDYSSTSNNKSRFEDSIDSNTDYSNLINNNNNINYQNDDTTDNDYENNLLINSNNNNSYLTNSYYGSI